jgi:hypothetical protein
MTPDIEAIDAAGAAFWNVTRCDHGCVHLHVGRCSITMSAEEFMHLRALLERAATELQLQVPHSAAH